MTLEFRQDRMRFRVNLPDDVAKYAFERFDDDNYLYNILQLRHAAIVDYDRKGTTLFFDCKPKKGVVEAAQQEIQQLIDQLRREMINPLIIPSKLESYPRAPTLLSAAELAQPVDAVSEQMSE